MKQVEKVICGVDFEAADVREQLAAVKEAGFTSVQIYTFWRYFEPRKRGEFDWNFFDEKVRLIREAGLKWVPFLLIGPKYAAPEWFLDDPAHVGLVCLEHGRESKIESIWNPAFRPEIERVVSAFADHYRSWEILESVQPGICGDYGEAIMPVHGNWPGDYHTHRGYWCGDRFARASWRDFVFARYRSIGTLNAAWRTAFAGFDAVEPFLPHRAPSRTAWFDFIDWYQQSMSEFADFWMACCRRHLPDTPIYLCTGGQEEPQLAANFPAQAKLAARHGGGIRLTNETNRYFDNFFLTAYMHSACEFYGAYLGLEPVGPLTEEGVAARIFGSADYGNRQIFFYSGNVFRRPTPENPALTDGRTAVWKRYCALLEEHPASADVAIFWPERVGQLGAGVPEELKPLAVWLRQQLPVMPVSDTMILDGALERFKLLVIPIDAFARREVLAAIAAWTRRGGVVFALGELHDIELESVPEYDAIFGILPESDRYSGLTGHHAEPHPEFPAFSATTKEFFTADHAWARLADGVEILAACPPPPPVGYYEMPRAQRCASAFRCKCGDGAGIFWSGPHNFSFDPQSLFRYPVVLPALLTDILRLYTGSAMEPARDGEVVRGRFGGRTQVLTEEFEIIPS